MWRTGQEIAGKRSGSIHRCRRGFRLKRDGLTGKQLPGGSGLKVIPGGSNEARQLGKGRIKKPIRGTIDTKKSRRVLEDKC